MSTLRRRLLLSHILPVLFIIPILGISLIYVLETRVVLVNLSTQLVRQAWLLADFSADYPAIWHDAEQAEAFVDRFNPLTTAQIMLVAGDGRMLSSSDPMDVELVGQHVENAPLDAILSEESYVRTNYNQNLRAEIADIWVPVKNRDGELLGTVRLTHQLANVQERFQRVRTSTVQVLFLGLLFGGATALVLAHTLNQPILRLTQAIQSMVHGEQFEPVAEEGPRELRILATEFNALVERLNILRSARRRLLANLVHELGRPLGALRSANQALLDGAEEVEELRHSLLAGIDVELASLQRVLDDLTRYYDRDLGPMELDLEPTALSPWLTTVLAHWGQAARTRDIQWNVSISPTLPTLEIDSDRLAQALGNLVSNAVKYTPPGGTIAVEASLDEDEVQITVRDTGPGIPAEEQSRIFEPFFRSRQQERFSSGIGLGLAIARDLVAAHGGRLSVVSQPGEGSAFTIKLPC